MTRRRVVAVVSIIGLLAAAGQASGSPPPVEDLAGVWSGAAVLGGGAPAHARLAVTVTGGGLQAEGVVTQPDGRAALRWEAPARLNGDTVVVEGLRLAAGITGVLAAAETETLAGRWTLTADGALVGGLMRADGRPLTSERLRRAARTSVTAGAGDALRWVGGGFVEGDERCPQLHANDPEIITSIDQQQVIAVSTLEPAGRAHPSAHLGHAFTGRFRIFASNQNRTGRVIHQVIALHAPGSAPVRVRVRALTSFATGEAPYRDWSLPDERVTVDPVGQATSGPGDAAASAALRGWRRGPAEVVVAPGASRLLLTLPVPVGHERMTHAELVADAPVQAAVLYLSVAPDAAALERALRAGRLLPRSAHDREPTPPGATSGALIYGRVAGVVAASTWAGRVTNDDAGLAFVTTPGAWRFGWNALRGPDAERMVAPMLARNPSSAYRAWGSYGAELRLELPLENPTATPARVAVFLESLAAPAQARAFRGTFEVTELDGAAATRTWVHVIQRAGARGRTPLAALTLAPRARRAVGIRTVYSANNQTPHALRIEVGALP